MDIKTLIFDFGNVVGFFDHRLTTRRLVRYSTLPADTLHANLFASELEDDYEAGRLTTAEFVQEIRRVCLLDCADEVIATAWADIFAPNPDICDLIPRLKPHYRLLLGSNTNELHSLHFLKQFESTLSLFDAIVLSYAVGARKPQAAFFQHCVKAAGGDPSQCVFIDDLEANVAGARACGLHGIVYKGLEDLQGELHRLGVRFQ
jgi:glucose-1-phosphatase